MQNHNFLCKMQNDQSYFKDRAQYFSIQIVMNECFLLSLKQYFGTDQSCRIQEKRKNRLTPTHSNSENMTLPSRRLEG